MSVSQQPCMWLIKPHSEIRQILELKSSAVLRYSVANLDPDSVYLKFWKLAAVQEHPLCRECAVPKMRLSRGSILRCSMLKDCFSWRRCNIANAVVSTSALFPCKWFRLYMCCCKDKKSPQGTIIEIVGGHDD